MEWTKIMSVQNKEEIIFLFSFHKYYYWIR